MYFSFSADVEHVKGCLGHLISRLQTTAVFLNDCSFLYGHKGASAVRESEQESDSTLCTSDVTASQWACLELVLCCVRMGVGGRRKAVGEVMGMYLRIYEENQAEKLGRREGVRW